MLKKGDLVEVVDLDEYSIDMGVSIGMIAKVIECDGCYVKVWFNDHTAKRGHSLILYAKELKLMSDK